MYVHLWQPCIHRTAVLICGRCIKHSTLEHLLHHCMSPSCGQVTLLRDVHPPPPFCQAVLEKFPWRNHCLLYTECIILATCRVDTPPLTVYLLHHLRTNAEDNSPSPISLTNMHARSHARTHTCTHAHTHACTHCVPNVHDYCIIPPSISPTTDNISVSSLPPSHQPQTMLLHQPSLHLTNHRQYFCIIPPSISPTTDNISVSSLPPSHQPQTM